MEKDWIQKAIKNKGSLRKTLKVKAGKKIPLEKLKVASKGKYGAKTAQRARLALTLRKLSTKK